jgi:hypothetical protein
MKLPLTLSDQVQITKIQSRASPACTIQQLSLRPAILRAEANNCVDYFAGYGMEFCPAAPDAVIVS